MMLTAYVITVFIIFYFNNNFQAYIVFLLTNENKYLGEHVEESTTHIRQQVRRVVNSPNPRVNNTSGIQMSTHELVQFIILFECK